MRTGRPKVELLLTDEERSQSHSFARSRSLPATLCNRARNVRSSAEGELNSAIRSWIFSTMRQMSATGVIRTLRSQRNPAT